MRTLFLSALLLGAAACGGGEQGRPTPARESAKAVKQPDGSTRVDTALGSFVTWAEKFPIELEVVVTGKPNAVEVPVFADVAVEDRQSELDASAP